MRFVGSGLPRRGTLALVALVAASSIVRYVGAVAVPTPWIMPDEAVYGLLARALAHDGVLAILGGPTPYYSLIYPALLAAPLALGLGAVKLVQAVVVSLVAVPVFVWARRLAPERWALAAAALTLALPALAYAGMLMTEVAFLPVSLCALWALASALERPTLVRQLTLVAMVVLAVATRLQGIVLLPTAATALVVLSLWERRRPQFVVWIPTVCSLGVLGAAWIGYSLRDGGPWTKVLGGYAQAGAGGYGLAGAAAAVVEHTADALLLVAVLPAVAVGVLVACATRGLEGSGAVRAYLAVTVSYGCWLLLQVGVFASRHVGGILERDLVTLAPLLLIGFSVWLARGAPRPQPWGLLTAVAAGAVLFTLSLPARAAESEAADAFMLVALAEFLSHEVAYAAAVAAALLLFALLPSRLRLLLPSVVLVALAVASVAATVNVANESELRLRKLLASDPTWVDRTAQGTTAYLYDGDAYWNAVWLHVLWNRRIGSVLALYDALVPGPLPQRAVFPLPDGRVAFERGGAPDEEYVVASSAIALVGEPVAAIAQTNATQVGLRLWRVERPLRLSTWETGRHPNGDIPDVARLTVFGCSAGVFRATIIVKSHAPIEVRRDGVPVDRRQLDPGAGYTVEVPAGGRAAAGSCVFEISSGGLVGSTVFEFLRYG